MPDTLVEHLASMDIRRLGSQDIAVEIDFAKREQSLSNDEDFCAYLTKRIVALSKEQERRRILREHIRPTRNTIDFIRELKTRIDIRDIFNDYLGILVIPSRTGREFYACPAHSDVHPSGVIYVQEQTYHCFQCNAHGDVFDCLMAFKGMAFMQAVDAVAGYLGIEAPRDKVKGFTR
jgi:hypothetical protein